MIQRPKPKQRSDHPWTPLPPRAYHGGHCGELTIVVCSLGGCVATGSVSATQRAAGASSDTPVFPTTPLQGGSATQPVFLPEPSGWITVTYSGDLVYPRSSATIPVTRGRPHAAR